MRISLSSAPVSYFFWAWAASGTASARAAARARLARRVIKGMGSVSWPWGLMVLWMVIVGVPVQPVAAGRLAASGAGPGHGRC